MPARDRTRGFNPMTFPGVSDTYKIDPRVAAASALSKTGMSTAPVASGGWGIAEGLSRALSGYLGGRQTEKLQAKYADESERREDIYQKARETVEAAKGGEPAPAQVEQVAQATEQATTPAPATPPPQVAPLDLTGKTSQGPLAQPINNLSPQLQAAAALAGQTPTAGQPPAAGPIPPPGPAAPPPGPVAPPPMAGAPPPNPTLASVPRGRGATPAAMASPPSTRPTPAVAQAAPAPTAQPAVAPAGGGGSRFNAIMEDWMRGVEGGYNPRDIRTGMPVNFGIDQKAHPNIDVKKLTWNDAKQIYHDEYFVGSGADKIDDPALQLVHMDTAVNMGVGTAKRMLAKSGGDYNKYMQMREARHNAIARNDKERGIWANRNAKLWAYAGDAAQGKFLAGDTGAAGDTGGEIGGSQYSRDQYQVAEPELAEVQKPDLIAPPELPPSPRSRRVAMAEALASAGQGDGLINAASREEYEQALKFDEEMAKQRDENVAQLYNTGYQSQAQTYGTMLGERYRAQVGERTQAQTHNRQVILNEQAAAIAKEAARIQSQYKISEDAAREEAKAKWRKNVEQRMPVGAQAEYRGKIDMIKQIDTIIGQVGKVKDTFGLWMGAVPAEMRGRMTPEATAARADLFNLVSAIMKERAGSAVTASEYPRLKEFLPLKTDNADMVLTKLNRLRNIAQQGQQTLEVQYGTDNPYIAGFQTQGAAPSQGWGPTQVTG